MDPSYVSNWLLFLLEPVTALEEDDEFEEFVAEGEFLREVRVEGELI